MNKTATLLISTTLGLAALWASENEAHAGCNEITVCVNLEVEGDDSLTGDYATGQTVPARGLRTILTPPAPESAKQLYLDDNGCVTFESDYNYGFKLAVYAEAFLGPSHHIRLRVFETEDEANNPGNYPVEPMAVLHLGGAANGDTITRDIPLTTLTNMLGYASAAIYRIENAIVSPLGEVGTPFPMMLRIYTADNNGDLGAKQESDRLIFVGAEARKRKFVFSHEIGHWYHHNWSGKEVLAGIQSMTGIYGYDVLDSPCEFSAPGSNSWHGIRSAEWSRGAVAEGFAQFISALAFNDPTNPDAEFEYYKDIDLTAVPDYTDLVEDDDYIISLNDDSSGGDDAWVENMCPNDWDYPYDPGTLDDHTGSEIDWMRFFWRFTTSTNAGLPGQNPLPSAWHILKAFENLVPPGENTPIKWEIRRAWSNLHDEFADSGNTDLFPYKSRFEAVSNQIGVHNEGP